MKYNQCGTDFEYNYTDFNVNENSGLKNTEKVNKGPQFYNKWWFWVIVALTVICIVGNSNKKSNTTANLSVDSHISSEQFKANKSVESIKDFGVSNCFLEVGKSITLSTEITPKGISKDDIVINNSDNSVINITDIELKNDGDCTKVSFKCSAAVTGASIVKLTSIDGKLFSNNVAFTVEKASKVKNISDFSPDHITDEIGDTREVTVYMTPSGISKNDFKITNTNSSVISVSDIKVKNSGDETVLTFKTSAIKAGNTKIAIVSSDGKTASNEIVFTVKENKNAGNIVYVTPYGKKYHFSASCAGKNAAETTLDEAEQSGKSACGKCTD